MSVFDVAEYILQVTGPITAMKLQKLVYYSQAWGLVWDEEPVFDERIEAWANGPVVPVLYQAHRGKFEVSPNDFEGSPENLSQGKKDTINRVLDFYADKSALWLSELTHMEAPWLDARKGLQAGQRSNHEITHAAMAEYYASL